MNATENRFHSLTCCLEIIDTVIDLLISSLHFNFPPFFASIQSDSLLLDDFEIAQLFMNHSRPRHRVPRAQSHQSEGAETKARCPDSSTCDVLVRDQEKASPVHPLNAGAPSSKLSTEDQTADPTLTRPKEETDTPAADSRPQEMLTN
ncbi:uncharacterized protein mbpa isoform X3 [Astatotilapia calliptera]|uniref:uncharacterized protein mbpa isoform X3 n=1 Tax=Astatotilapia calliptera TaxID=8154 RepID=UPI000E417DB9|nr:uncharacterized protein LOC113014974 isoform X3 [Astatotilapia calliptera]